MDRLTTHHEQCFTKSSASLSQNFVRIERNNTTKGEDERMYIFHVEIIRGHGIRNGVLS